MNTYAITYRGYTGREYTETIVAETPSKAKYALFVKNEYESEDFPLFIKNGIVSCHLIHRFRVSDLFGDIERFNEMKTRRGIHFAYIGQRVEVDGKSGVIIGSNSAGNLDVCFTGTTCGSNCHPYWRVKYFDANGNIIREYGD